MDVQFATEPPPDELVTNVHVICFVGDEIVLCRDDREVWIVPGGTREAGESIADCVVRELREEAGASLAGPLRTIGAHYAVSDRPAPYKPWQPHPRKAWLWCTADVVLDSAPTNPDDAEHILEVRTFPLTEALKKSRTDGPHLPPLLELAAELHRIGSR
ncbi:NUDIX domain-containing protein [Nocardia terpenica]|uniref:NUDIX domain-containing protein n=1 Tax=Nocardia terpenica TaxID=455432 RepID=A0A6G9ZFY5_9NOCA|nr:NUDIX domain-containing protein [Nocardia terpenica]